MTNIALFNPSTPALQVSENDPSNWRRAAVEDITRQETQAADQARQARALAAHYTALAVEFEAIADTYATSRSRLAGRAG